MDEIVRVSKKLHHQLLMDGDVLLSNKTAGALLRDAELDVVKRREKPINLNTLMTSNLDHYIGRDVVFPEHLRSILGHGPLSKEEVHAIEEQTEAVYGVKPPYYIAMSLTLQQTGRAWAYVPEAAPYLTGLTLQRECDHDVH